MKCNIKKITYSSLLATLVFSMNLGATSLKDSIEQAINTNPDIASEHYNKKENRLDIDKEKGDYYPTLDFTTYFEDSKTVNKYEDDTPDNTANENGWNAILEFEQVLYDGGQTPKEVEQARHKYYNIKYTSKDVVEDILLEVTDTYLDLLLNQTLEAFGKFKLKAHNYYLKLAEEKEDISGEILDRLQVQSKINSLIDSNLNQEVKKQKSYSAYKRLTGQTISGNICRPIIDETLIPNTLEEAITHAIQNDNSIRAQYELVQEQKAGISIQRAKFLPDLKFQIQAEWDNDLTLSENGQQNIYKTRLESAWNFYEGGKDSISLEKEKIATLKERKILDAIKNDVRDEITSTYNTYFQLKKRIKNLKEFVDINNQIVSVYREQLKEGSRTFLDLLTAESEVFRTRILLEEEETNKYKEYFNILKVLNKLSDSILTQHNIVCKQFDISTILPNYEEQYNNKEVTLEDTAKELGLEE